ncbi:MAG: hypothetical protein IKF42_08255 [Mogibacterium sp.]|nr:hypothetical protein [Mogibacterium sp.]
MKKYSVYLCDGTFIDIEAEGWYIEDDMIFFIEVPGDESSIIRAAFTVQNIAGFCEVNE